MILVDKDILQRAQNGELFSKETFNPENVNAISYDLTVDCIQINDESHKQYKLAPGETVFIKSKEVLIMPDDLMGRIGEKNSRMRMGIEVSGPHYYPGHKTNAFLRAYNMSDSSVMIQSGDSIAQIFFEQLTDVPNNTYNSTFQNEYNYTGFGSKYQEEYEKRIHSAQKVKNNIKEKERQIYSNVLLLISIFVAMFSVISVNFRVAPGTAIDAKSIITMNTSLCLCIIVMLCLVLIFLNKGKRKWCAAFYAVIFAALAVLTVVLCL